jgi:hypothetical protein
MRATIAPRKARYGKSLSLPMLPTGGGIDRAGRVVAVSLRAHSPKNFACFYNALGVAYLSLGDAHKAIEYSSLS